MTEQPWAYAAQAHPMGDLGRRIAQRRTELGLSRTDAAARAGMAPGYLQHLEEHPTASPGTAVLLKLAGALDTTVGHLAGGDVELPPGLGQAARAPRVTELTEAECRALLSTHGVGRLAVATVTGPVIVPVNYSVIDGAVVLRSAPGGTPAEAVGRQVAFEVDRIDEAFSQGWSVLVRGRARAVTDPVETTRLAARAYSKPWTGGHRDEWLSIRPIVVTGRRIMV